MKYQQDSFWTPLSKWWSTHQRIFPWRYYGATAYDILLAEVALKRTTATAATRVFKRLKKSYPNVQRLAFAREKTLIKHFLDTGLQSQRARGLKNTATFICAKFNGNIPDNLKELLSIPNVGDYTARAILAFAYNQPLGVVDSNIVRIIKRFCGEDWGGVNNTTKQVQNIVDKLVPVDDGRNFNWAMLDLGSLVCRYDRPLCSKCPLALSCAYAIKQTR